MSEFSNRIAPEYEERITLAGLRSLGFWLIVYPDMPRETAWIQRGDSFSVIDLRTDEERAEDAKRFAPNSLVLTEPCGQNPVVWG